MTTNELKILHDAERALDALGDNLKVYELLEPLLIQNNPAALFLYSTFSIGKETDEEFETRRIDLLKKSAEGEYLPAIYELAVCYDLGDIIAQDHLIAGKLYEKAAQAGYSKAKLSHGLNLFYGSHGIAKDQELGLSLIKQAANENVDDALNILNQLQSD